MTAMTERLIRYVDLVPCLNAFIDTRSPGSNMKENFTLIGRGVGENPGQYVHITEKHGFNVSGARQPKGCLNSQHSHEHAEIFVVHSGHWQLMFGKEAGEDGTLDIAPGDVVSVPIHMFRGFKKLDEGSGFLWVPLGQDDPGKVLWAPKVYDLADQYGLQLTKSGRLVDIAAGETLQPGEMVDHGPDATELARHQTPSADHLAQCVARYADMVGNPNSPLAVEGVEECPVIGPVDTDDGFQAGPIIGWWPHGFSIRLLKIASGACTATHIREEQEVLFVQEGTLKVELVEDSIVMAAGDTFTTPKGARRAFRAISSGGCRVFVIRGAESPAMPQFVGN